ELLLRHRVRVDVGMVLPRQPPVGALDVFRGGVPTYAQDPVVVLVGHVRPFALALNPPRQTRSISSAPAGRRRSVPRHARSPSCRGSPSVLAPARPCPPRQWCLAHTRC